MPTEATQAYPEARTERNPPRSAAPTVVAAKTAQPPRSRHFAFDIAAAAGLRNMVSTPRLVGNVIIQQVSVKNRVAAEPPVFSVELGWSLSPVVETAIPRTNTKNWNAIMNRVQGTYPGALTANIGMTQVNVVGGGGLDVGQLYEPILIVSPELFLVVGILNAHAATTWFGTVEVLLLEGVSDETALNFR